MVKSTPLKCQCPFSFFGLGSDYRPSLHNSLFDIAYHSNGGFTWDAVYEMPVHLRRYYLKRLHDVKKKEQEEMDKAKSKSKAPRMPTRRR